MTQIDLVIPGLCGPLPDMEPLSSESVQLLIQNLSKADQQVLSQDTFYGVLSELFLLDKNKVFPTAALSLLASGNYTEEGYWFRADPVHLLADMDHAILRDSHGLDLSLEESEALITELNEHFREDGLRFLMNDKDSWFVNVGDYGRISTTPVHDVISRNVYSFMPQGEDALYWKKIMNEVQMLMYQSQVNVLREKKNKLPVNGVWLWGEGDLPVKSVLNKMTVHSRHSLVKGLATLNELDYYEITDVRSFIDQVSINDKNLLVLDDLFNVTCYGDVLAWQSSLDKVYEQWVSPILDWAMNKKNTLNLHACNGVVYQIEKKKRFKFFRDKRIASYIKTYE